MRCGQVHACVASCVACVAPPAWQAPAFLAGLWVTIPCMQSLSLSLALHWMQGLWMLLVDTDDSPDGEVWAWCQASGRAAASSGKPPNPAAAAGGDGGHAEACMPQPQPEQRVQAVVRGRRGCQLLDLQAVAGTYLALSTLQDMQARVDVYRIARRGDGGAPGGASDALCDAQLYWTYCPGPSIASLHLQHGAWPAGAALLRVSYSNMTTPVTTVDLDLAASSAHITHVSTHSRRPAMRPACARARARWKCRSWAGCLMYTVPEPQPCVYLQV